MIAIELSTIVSSAVGTIFALFAKEFLEGFVRRNQKNENDRDGDVAEIFAAIERVRDLSDEFWVHSAEHLAEKDNIAHGRLTASLHQINLLYTDLFTGDAKRHCDVAHVRFMDAVGGGDFGQPSRQADPNRLINIHGNALNLKDVVRRERRKLRRSFLS